MHRVNFKLKSGSTTCLENAKSVKAYLEEACHLGFTPKDALFALRKIQESGINDLELAIENSLEMIKTAIKLEKEILEYAEKMKRRLR